MIRSPEEKFKILRHLNSRLKNALKHCAICPRKCGVDRVAGKVGYCRAPFDPVVYSFFAHHGEEPALSGIKGSGTIFFSHCNMKCVYCQNYYFSQLDRGQTMTIEKIAATMLELQKIGCHNINFVSPAHYMPQILSALEIALEKGLRIPLVYNSSGYDLPDFIRLLDGIIDIYLPDMRYADDAIAKKYSDAEGYVEYNRASVLEMQRQVGDLAMTHEGIAEKGLIIRLLVLPEDISGTAETLRFIAQNISRQAYLSIMSQYCPTYKAYNYVELSRGITQKEYKLIVDEASQLGLNNGWIQEMPEDTRFLGTNITPDTERL